MKLIIKYTIKFAIVLLILAECIGVNTLNCYAGNKSVYRAYYKWINKSNNYKGYKYKLIDLNSFLYNSKCR